MKIRKSFVTNSSSSSFICDVCGDDVSGWDMTLSEAGMMECVNGHTICEHHVGHFDARKTFLEMIKNSIEDYKESAKKYDVDGKTYYTDRVKELEEELEGYLEDDLEDHDWDELLDEFEFRYNIPTSLCPICNFKELTDSDATAYMLHKYGVDIETLKREIRNNFSDYSQFKSEIKGK